MGQKAITVIRNCKRVGVDRLTYEKITLKHEISLETKNEVSY